MDSRRHPTASSLFQSRDDYYSAEEDLCAAVLVPGFLTGADEFQPLCQTLTERSLPTLAVPMPN